MKLIQTVALTSTSSVISFSSIPQTYSDLVILVSPRTTDGAGAYQSATLSVNGSTANQSERYIYSTTTATPVSTTYTTFESWPAGNGATANSFGSMYYYITNYSTSNATKSFTWDIVAENNGTGWIGVVGSGTWSNTAAITSLTLNANWAIGSTASLYGINPIPTASLGAPTAVDYLVVAGGGSGNQGFINAGGLAGGGGGAGGMLTGTALGVSSGTAITVTVGAGGAFVANLTNSAANGNNSAFSTITATGGGGGGMQSRQGANGGSGGGGGGNNSGAGTGIAGQGYAGGSGNNYPGDNPSGDGKAGGGGGAGGVGTNNAGGSGVVSTIDGFSKTYAKGGDGALYNGGAGAPVPASTGYGGNGGGGTNAGSSGASGIVIIRYPQTYTAPTATTGNPAVNYINGYRVYTWYNSGSITF